MFLLFSQCAVSQLSASARGRSLTSEVPVLLNIKGSLGTDSNAMEWEKCRVALKSGFDVMNKTFAEAFKCLMIYMHESQKGSSSQ